MKDESYEIRITILANSDDLSDIDFDKLKAKAKTLINSDKTKMFHYDINIRKEQLVPIN